MTNKTSCIRPWFSWTLFSLYNFLLFYLSLLPGDELAPVWTDLSDKALHASGYFILFAVTLYAFLRSGNAILRQLPYLWAACWTLNIAAVTEGLQHFVPGRFTDAYDLAANTAGIATAGILLKITGWDHCILSGTKKRGI